MNHREHGGTEMKKLTIEFYESCQSCGGTGLYVGLAERDGSAVVCHHCKGTGKFHFRREYEPFTARKVKADIHRVFEVNPGICIGVGNGHRLEDFGGMPFENWNAGQPFPSQSENRKFTCPAWWYQSADYDKKPRWYECCVCGPFSKCIHFPSKHLCWERFDKESSSLQPKS